VDSKYLFRSQVNELIREILKTGLESTLFEFDRDISNMDFQIEIPLTIKLRNSSFNFRLIHFAGDFQSHYFPSLDKKMGDVHKVQNTWQDLVAEFILWLGRVKEEINEPNPWLLLNQGNILTNEVPTGVIGGEQFSQAELVKLHEHINIVKEFLISEVKPSKEEFSIINEKLTFLEETALRQNKKDWAYTAIGITFTIAVGLAMSPEQSHKLFAVMSEFIKAISLKLLQ
jgi:hypothetical protein